MNQRQRNLLLHLLHQHHYQTIQEVSAAFPFSEKTLRNDIKAINAYLQESGVDSRIETKRGSGIRMHIEVQDEEYVRYLLDSRILEIKPDLDRFYHGMILLLFQKETYTMDSLALELYTNRLQLKEDMKRWESMLKQFQLTLVKSEHLLIKGEERQLRLFLLYYFYQIADKAMIMKIEPVLLANNTTFFHKILHICEADQEQRLTVNALHHFSIYLGIMVKRIQLGHTLDQEAALSPIQQKVRHMLADEFHLEIAAEEIQFFFQMFRNGARQWNPDMVERYVVEEESQRMSERFFTRLLNQYHTPVDEQLPRLFAILLQTALERRRDQMRVVHYYDENVKYDSLASFLCMMQLFYEDDVLSQLCIYESEYTRLAMLMTPYFQSLAHQRKVRIGLVVNCSLELAYYGEITIRKAIPEIDITCVLTEEEIPAKTAQVDYFISFEYLKQAVPYVEINSVIKEEDIQKLKQFHIAYLREKALMTALPIQHSYGDVRSEEELWQIGYEKLCHHDCQIPLEAYLHMSAISRLYLPQQILIILYDSRIPASFIEQLRLAHPLYLEGNQIEQVSLIALHQGSHDALLDDIQRVEAYLRTCQL